MASIICCQFVHKSVRKLFKFWTSPLKQLNLLIQYTTEIILWGSHGHLWDRYSLPANQIIMMISRIVTIFGMQHHCDIYVPPAIWWRHIVFVQTGWLSDKFAYATYVHTCLTPYKDLHIVTAVWHDCFWSSYCPISLKSLCIQFLLNGNTVEPV